MQWLALIILATGFLFALPLPAYAENAENRIDTQVQRRLAMGDKANRLIDEKSPYLLQHAFNPVDWYPWGEEAMGKARSEDKPIFLSIGYSTCHWCHVMAHESFENDKIAEILNKWFVSIKVDREERPDIDQMYMAATQAMTGSGGWPMSVFLFPDGSPFYAGTYFAPTAAYQKPGFADLLEAIHTAWQERRADLQQAAQRLVSALGQDNTSAAVSIRPDILKESFEQLSRDYDPKEGGFGKAPKFPRPAVLTFLFNHYLFTGEEKARDMVLYTLEKMAAGGMYDHIGGGFHRYSVDDHWFVPHFEKMLYDQSQLADAYLDGFLITGQEQYARLAEEIFTYVLRDMRDPAGGFYSAEDADSDNPYMIGQHGEGAFYLWTKEDIVHRLSGKASDIFAFTHGVKTDGNVLQDPMQEFSGLNILHRAHSTDEAAARFKMKGEDVKMSLAASKDLLFTARSVRKRPHLDDKIITAWNGLLIGALARGSRILEDPQLLDSAIQAALFIRTTLYDPSSHQLQRRYREGEAGLTGQLDDYVYLVDGLLDLYQVSQDPQWLKWSLALTERQIALFWNEKGGFFYDSAVDHSVKVRMRGMYDGAEPAGNSVAAHNLLRLGLLQDRKEWTTMVRKLMESFSEVINRHPPALPLMLTAWQQAHAKPLQIIIAGERDAEDTETLRRIVDRHFAPASLFLLADGGANQAFLKEKLPFLETVRPIEGKAAAYVCRDFTCQLPVTDPAALELLLKEEQNSAKP